MFHRNIVVGPFQCNCRLLACPKTGDAILIDPGDEPEAILATIKEFSLSQGMDLHIKYLLHTHGHLDHIGGTRDVYQHLHSQKMADPKKDNAPKIALHRDDQPLYTNLKVQGQLFGLDFEDPLPVNHYLQDMEEIQVGELKFTIIHTPGHSPGSISIRLHENQTSRISETVFSGDTLFQGSVGRTDLWGANQEQMFKSIRKRLLTLDDDTLVCPGHGPDTRIGIEKRQNPFLV